MKSPFPIKSEEYREAWTLLYREVSNELKHAKTATVDGLKETNFFLNLLQKPPDSSGAFKRAYFVKEKATNKELVFLLEIGSVDFFEIRDGLMKELSKYASNEHMIIPELYAKKVLESDDGDKYVVLVTKTQRCQQDLQQWMLLQRSVNVVELVSQFADLYEVLSEMLDDKLFFTDVKASNIIHCGGNLAFIDLDSVLTVSDIFDKKEIGALTLPEGEQFYRFRTVIVQDKKKYESGKWDERVKEDVLLLYKFYTLFAFSLTVFQYYWYSMYHIDILDSPDRFLPPEDELMDILEKQFPRKGFEGHRRMQRLLLLCWHMVKFVYGDDLPTKELVREYLGLWSGTEENFRSFRKRKESVKRRREERLLPKFRIRKPLLF